MYDVSIFVNSPGVYFSVTFVRPFRKRAAVEEVAADELAPAVLKISVLRAKDLLVKYCASCTYPLLASTSKGQGLIEQVLAVLLMDTANDLHSLAGLCARGQHVIPILRLVSEGDGSGGNKRSLCEDPCGGRSDQGEEDVGQEQDP